MDAPPNSIKARIALLQLDHVTKPKPPPKKVGLGYAIAPTGDVNNFNRNQDDFINSNPDTTFPNSRLSMPIIPLQPEILNNGNGNGNIEYEETVRISMSDENSNWQYQVSQKYSGGPQPQQPDRQTPSLPVPALVNYEGDNHSSSRPTSLPLAPVPLTRQITGTEMPVTPEPKRNEGISNSQSIPSPTSKPSVPSKPTILRAASTVKSNSSRSSWHPGQTKEQNNLQQSSEVKHTQSFSGNIEIKKRTPPPRPPPPKIVKSPTINTTSTQQSQPPQQPLPPYPSPIHQPTPSYPLSPEQLQDCVTPYPPSTKPVQQTSPQYQYQPPLTPPTPQYNSRQYTPVPQQQQISSPTYKPPVPSQYNPPPSNIHLSYYNPNAKIIKDETPTLTERYSRVFGKEDISKNQQPRSTGPRKSLPNIFKDNLSNLTTSVNDFILGTPTHRQPSVENNSHVPSHYYPPPSLDLDTSSYSTSACYECLDYSLADEQGAKFPRKTVPSIPSLAQNLTYIFPNPIMKARAIFSWLHHNIDYDVNSYFNGTVRHKTPDETLRTGLGVCQGYAELFEALCRHAGLEAIVISGYGKGFGHIPYSGGPIPAFSSNHAWNAVKLNGEWKLIDPCWGAGHLNGSGQYEKAFDPKHFTHSNELFGLRHFPTKPEHQFCSTRVSWEDFILKNGPKIYDGFKKNGLSDAELLPNTKRIPSGQPIKFVVKSRCKHYQIKPEDQYVLLLTVNHHNHIPLRMEVEGQVWSVVVPSLNMGTVQLNYITKIGGRSAKGVTVEQYESSRMKLGMGWSVMAEWEVY